MVGELVCNLTRYNKNGKKTSAAEKQRVGKVSSPSADNDYFGCN